jgi:hypothetical protein
MAACGIASWFSPTFRGWGVEVAISKPLFLNSNLPRDRRNFTESLVLRKDPAFNAPTSPLGQVGFWHQDTPLSDDRISSP